MRYQGRREQDQKGHHLLFSGVLQSYLARNGAVEPGEVDGSEERSNRMEPLPKEGRSSGDGSLVDRWVQA
jgi:hypothetical protein